MSILRVFCFFHLICVAFSQTQSKTSILTASPVTTLQSSSASFQYPRATETLVVNVVDTVVVQWKSNFLQNAFLYIWCDNGVPGSNQNNNRRWSHDQVNTTGSSEISPSLYVDKVKQDWTRPYACHFDLTYEDVYTKNVPGPNFIVTSIPNQGITRTYAYLNTVPPIPFGSASPGEAMSNTMTVLSSPTSSWTARPAASSNKLSTGGIAGIAIGAIIGLIVLVVLGFTVWRKRKANKLRSKVHTNDSSMHQDGLVSSRSRYKDMHRHQNHPVELEEQRKTHELPGSNSGQ